MSAGVVNLEYLEEISGGDKLLISEMIGIFNSEVPGYVSLMRELLDAGDYAALGKIAHKAKASASIMGMKDVAENLKDLEKLTKENTDISVLRKYTDDISDRFMSAIRELKLISESL